MIDLTAHLLYMKRTWSRESMINNRVNVLFKSSHRLYHTSAVYIKWKHMLHLVTYTLFHKSLKSNKHIFVLREVVIVILYVSKNLRKIEIKFDSFLSLTAVQMQNCMWCTLPLTCLHSGSLLKALLMLVLAPVF